MGSSVITKTATWHKPKRHRTRARARARARPAGVALVTGRTGALGLQLGAWLVRTRRCGSLVLVSRSGDVGAANAPLLEALRQAVSEAGGEVSLSLVAADVTSADEVRALLAEHAHGLAHGGGLYHCAGVLDHGLLPSQSAERLGGVMLPKTTAAVLLHELLAELAIAVGAFVLFSSVTSLAGAVGQTSYGAANAVLDALAGCGRHGLRHTAAWGRAGDARTSYGIGCLRARRRALEGEHVQVLASWAGRVGNARIAMQIVRGYERQTCAAREPRGGQAETTCELRRLAQVGGALNAQVPGTCAI